MLALGRCARGNTTSGVGTLRDDDRRCITLRVTASDERPAHRTRQDIPDVTPYNVDDAHDVNEWHGNIDAPPAPLKRRAGPRCSLVT